MKRFLFRAFAVGAALTGAVFVIAYFWLRTSLPVTDRDIVGTGVANAVSIVRDVNGLVTVGAPSHAETAFGLGYAHAQDRLWQMMSMRRFALGRLSEVLGEATLDIDMRQRRLGFGALAQAQYAILAPETRAVLDGYARGVNAYLATRGGALPLPFELTRLTPEAWQPWHGLLWGRLMAYQLSARWRQDLYRADALARLGPDTFADIWPGIATPPDIQTSNLGDMPTDYPTPLGASNAWAVAPGRSATGGALLAGDPHLGLSLPGTWYFARLEHGDRWVEGATAPGTPFVILGRNNDVAWSVTSNEADLQDVIAVTRADTVLRTETIRLRNGEVRAIDIRSIDGAPVVAGPIADGTGDSGFALLATALRADDRTPDAFMGLNLAENVDQSVAALRHFAAPLLNVHAADTQGRIARVHAGRLPARGGLNGRFPLPAGTIPWAAPLAHDVLPTVIDPIDGYVGNANERTAELDRAPFAVVGDWPADERGQRLRDLAATWDDVGLDDMIAAQLDTLDVTATLWRETLSGLPVSGDTATARDILQTWDGRMQRDRPAPLIYAAWMAELSRAVFAEKMGELFGKLPLPAPRQLHAMIADGTGLCADNGCVSAPTESFETAVSALAETYGADPADWRWGDAHQGRFDHQLLSRLPAVGALFGRRIATDGGNRTLNRGAHRQRRGSHTNAHFLHIHGAGMRAVHDLAGAPSQYALATGQSGNPLSRHYDDLMRPWRDGAYVTFAAPPIATVRLLP